MLIETGARYGTAHSRPYIMDENLSVNIDGPVDKIIAERLIQANPRDYISKYSQKDQS